MSDRADIIFYGGDIITMEEPDPTSHRGPEAPPKIEAVAITGDTISAVGSIHTVFSHVGDKTQVIYLNKQTLMPGFIEPHTHAILSAKVRSSYTQIHGRNYSSYDDIRKKMKHTLKDLTQDDWGLFFGWDPELIPDLPRLSAEFLDDEFSESIPMIVVGQSGHVAWVNSPALEAANISKDYESPIGGTVVLDADGNPTGQLLEAPAITLVTGKAPSASRKDLEHSLREQFTIYASEGLTTVTELVYRPEPNTDHLLKKLASKHDFPVRLGLYKLISVVLDDDQQKRSDISAAVTRYCCHLEGPTPNTDDSKKKDESICDFSPRLWEAGVKLIADGSPHAGTAAVREPYLNSLLTETLGFPKPPDYGALNYTNNDLLRTVECYNGEGTQVAIHCHGDRGCEQVLSVYEQVLAKSSNKNNRHRMEHLGLMTPEQISRAGKINLALSFFVDHLRFYASGYKNYIFGERVNRWAPLSEATKSGITWTIHQDHPTFPGESHPFANIKTAVTRCTRDDPTTPYGPEYCVSVHECLKAYTINAAWQLKREKELGSITVGKKADLVVLSENPYQVDPFDLERIEVIETFVDGRCNNLAQLKTIKKVHPHVLEPRKKKCSERELAECD